MSRKRNDLPAIIPPLTQRQADGLLARVDLVWVTPEQKQRSGQGCDITAEQMGALLGAMLPEFMNTPADVQSRIDELKQHTEEKLNRPLPNGHRPRGCDAEEDFDDDDADQLD